MNKISTNRLFLFLMIFILCFIAFVLRRPEIITNPQFWAEDGAVWFQQAHTIGPFKSLALPQNGYYQTISKLVASLSLLLPIYVAPLFFNIVGISIRCFVVLFLLSSRMDMYSIKGRSLLALFIVFMPHIDEVHANITNTHWYLSMWLFMVLIANESKGIYWKAHDYTILIISGLSGPFIVFLAPVLFLKIMNGKSIFKMSDIIKKISKSINAFNLTFTFICIIQVLAILLSTSDGRSHAPLGASLDVFSSILSSKIFIGFIISQAQSTRLWNINEFNYLISALGIMVMAFVFIKGDWRDKAVIIFPSLMIGFALAKPMIHMTLPQLPRIQFGPGQRYFVITGVFWLAILLIAIGSLKDKIRNTALLVIMFSAIMGCASSFKLQRLPNQDWISEVNKYNAAKSGELVIMKINPNKWTLRINKD